jgi:hypothetical protein
VYFPFSSTCECIDHAEISFRQSCEFLESILHCSHPVSDDAKVNYRSFDFQSPELTILVSNDFVSVDFSSDFLLLAHGPR